MDNKKRDENLTSINKYSENKRFTAKFVTSTQFYQLPKFLFIGELKTGLSNDAKILYALLKDRHELSIENNWVNDNGEVYLIYTRTDMMEMLGISKNTLAKAIKELKKFNLFEDVQRGLNQPNLIYLRYKEQSDVNKLLIQESAYQKELQKAKELTYNQRQQYMVSYKQKKIAERIIIKKQKEITALKQELSRISIKLAKKSGKSNSDLPENRQKPGRSNSDLPENERKSGRSNSDFPENEQKYGKSNSDLPENKQKSGRSNSDFLEGQNLTPNKTDNNKTDNNKVKDELIDETSINPSSIKEIERLKDIRSKIKSNINYDIMTNDRPDDINIIDNVVNIMAEILSCQNASATFSIRGNVKSLTVVQSVFWKLNQNNIEYVLFCLQQNTSDIKDIYKYTIACLYNSCITDALYYDQKVNSDFNKFPVKQRET